MEAIDQIRQVADIVDIASLYTTLNKRGRKHMGLCPFHSEKDPSFTVDSEKQLYDGLLQRMKEAGVSAGLSTSAP